MRLATVDNGSRDGQLVVVHPDGTFVAPVSDPRCISLRQALEDWPANFPILEELSGQLMRGTAPTTIPVAKVRFLSPLPRSWAFLDGSAFLSHVILVRKARGAEPPADMKTVPLMYQGISDTFLAPGEDVPLLDPGHGLDFEGEYAVIVEDTPLGVTAEEALSYVRLIVLLNDWSLRNLIPRELQAGFGFLQSKPASSFAPFALTPDELGEAWKDSRIHLPLQCFINGVKVGEPHGREMYFSFAELIAHAARTRRLSAGTIIGSGTVSNEDAKVGVSCLAEKRMREIIESGSAATPFLKDGDSVSLLVERDGRSLFGEFFHRVKAVEQR